MNVYGNDQSDFTFLQDYMRERSIKELQKYPIPNILDLSGKLCLVIDSSGVYELENFKPEVLILRNSPKVNLERIIDQLSPKKIIADGSNYHTFVNRWKITAGDKKIPFHHTGEKGAFIVNSNQ